MTSRTNQHAKGNQFKVNAGKHKGKTGMIVTVNPIRQWVVFDDGFLGFVHHSYCGFIKDETTVTSRDQDR
jgi:hypothetical protein